MENILINNDFLADETVGMKFNLISNNIDETDFYKAYNHIYFFGIDSYVLKYNLNKKNGKQ